MRVLRTGSFWLAYILYLLVSVPVVVASTLWGTLMVGLPVWTLCLLAGLVGAAFIARRNRNAALGLICGAVTIVVLPWVAFMAAMLVPMEGT